jgi:hypothetical protein
MRRLLPLVVLLTLTACTSWVDSTRTSIRNWCIDTPDWCDVNAVK